MPWKLITGPTVEPITRIELKAHLRGVPDSEEDAYLDDLIKTAREHVEEITWRALVNQTWDFTLSNFTSPIKIPRPPLSPVQSSAAAVTAATWTVATKTLTEANAFASYSFATGDLIYISAGTGATLGWYTIASKTDASNIVLTTNLAAGDLATGDIASQSIPYVKYYDTAGVQQTLADTVYELDTASEPGFVRLKYNQSWPTCRGHADDIVVRYVAGAGWAAANVPRSLRQAILLLAAQWFEHREPVITGTIATKIPMTVESLLAPYVSAREEFE